MAQDLRLFLFQTQVGKVGALPFRQGSIVLAIASGPELQNSLATKDVIFANMKIKNDDSGQGFKASARSLEVSGKLLIWRVLLGTRCM